MLVPQPALERDPLQAAALIETNLTGHVTTLLALAARMRAQGHGTIVVLSSVAAVRPRTFNLVYGAAKAGLDAFARGLADSLHGSGVRVLLVRPGFVTGRMTAGMPRRRWPPRPMRSAGRWPPRCAAGPAGCGCPGSSVRWQCCSGWYRGRPGAGSAGSRPVMRKRRRDRDGPGIPGQVRLLVAEDDPGLRAALARGLRESGYAVDAVPDGMEALGYLRVYEYEVAILDWRMPRRSGLDVLRELRAARSPVPVLMLTARDAAADRVTGLDQGADDYLIKPFDFSELLARIRALQRRPRTPQQARLTVGDLSLDPAARAIRVGTAQPAVTATELGILEMLMRRSPAVVARRSIALQVWDNEADALGSNTIDVHLARLRAKLAGGHVKIETVRGIGYRIVPS